MCKKVRSTLVTYLSPQPYILCGVGGVGICVCMCLCACKGRGVYVVCVCVCSAQAGVCVVCVCDVCMWLVYLSVCVSLFDV